MIKIHVMNGRVIEKFVSQGQYPKFGKPYTNTQLVVEIMWDREYKGKRARMNVSSNTPTGWLAIVKPGTLLTGLEVVQGRKLTRYNKGRGIILNPYSKVDIKDEQ